LIILIIFNSDSVTLSAAVIEVLSEEQQKFDTDLAGLPPALTRLLNRYLTFDAVREARL